MFFVSLLGSAPAEGRGMCSIAINQPRGYGVDVVAGGIIFLSFFFGGSARLCYN